MARRKESVRKVGTATKVVKVKVKRSPAEIAARRKDAARRAAATKKAKFAASGKVRHPRQETTSLVMHTIFQDLLEDVAVARNERGLRSKTVAGTLRDYRRSEVVRDLIVKDFRPMVGELPEHKQGRYLGAIGGPAVPELIAAE